MGVFHWVEAVYSWLGLKIIILLFVVGLFIVYLLMYHWHDNSSVTEKDGTTQDILEVESEAVVPPDKVQEISEEVPDQIRSLYTTKEDGRTWNSSSWTNKSPRTLKSGMRDSFDSEFIVRGNGQVYIDGNGIARLSGSAPRMYVYDPAKNMKWGDVEVTIYAKRVSETGAKSSQGIVIGARSEHQDATIKNPCFGTTYYGRLLYDGRAVFQKELVHEGAYSTNVPSEFNRVVWGTKDGTMPKNIWIGVKFIVKNNVDNKSVVMELYRDMTDGKNGGAWEKVAEYIDKGSWYQNDSGVNVLKKCGYPSNTVLLKPGTSVFVRNDVISEMQYKLFSVREIE